MRRFILLVLALLAPAAEAASPRPVAGRNGMVVTAHGLASRVGVDVLRAGGNAIDAAVAVGYALAVVHPSAGNLGGGGFATIVLADGRRTFLDFRERAPLAALETLYLDGKGDVVPGLSLDSWLAIGVPGTVAGLEEARDRYGTMGRQALLAPAIGLAARGFELDRGDAENFARSAEGLGKDAGAAAIFLHDGKTYAAGETLVQPDLANSLRAIAERGPAGFYRGDIAAAIVRASAAHGGILAAEDFAEYRVRELKPIECDYRGYRVVSAPPPSSGGVVLCEMLNVLEGYPLGDYGWGSVRALHAEIETMRHAYLDRNTYLGDPDFVRNPLERLLDKRYAARIRDVTDPVHAGLSADLKPGVGPHESTETTHFSIVDGAGNAVSVTYTLNGAFGAKRVAPGTGILLNNEMDDFTAKSGVPNLYGLVQGAANAVAPRKTPLSSMSPTVVTRDGKPVMVIGSPGGSRIITVVLEAILNVVDFGMTIQEAVDAPRIHQQWLPQETAAERFAVLPDARAILDGMGHTFSQQGAWGSAAGILIGAPSLGGKPVDGARFFGANDSRASTGAAIGF